MTREAIEREIGFGDMVPYRVRTVDGERYDVLERNRAVLMRRRLVIASPDLARLIDVPVERVEAIERVWAGE